MKQATTSVSLASLCPYQHPPALYLPQSDGSRLAYVHDKGSPDSPGVFFCCGFQSNMRGRKIEAIQHWCQTVAECEFTTLDYFGHGESLYAPSKPQDTVVPEAASAELLESVMIETGDPHKMDSILNHNNISKNNKNLHAAAKQCTVGRWLQDILNVLDTVTSPQSKLILVGSSMGTWLALLVAKVRPQRIAGIVGIASAPDAFPFLHQSIILPSPCLSQSMNTLGYCDIPSIYSPWGYYRIHKELIQESYTHLILDSTQNFDILSSTTTTTTIHMSIPVRLIHGKLDSDVPWQRSQLLFEALSARDKQIVYIDDGDHRLSRDSDLMIIIQQLEQVYLHVHKQKR